MKKICYVISLFMILFLSSCMSAEQTPHETTVINTGTYESAISEQIYIVYDTYYLEVRYVENTDIINYFVQAEEPLQLFLQYYDGNGLEVNESLNGIIDTLYDLEDASGIPFKSFLTYSATDLNAVAAQNSITLTIDDIVGFYDLVSLFENIDRQLVMSSIDYIEIVLERSITNIEIHALNELQKALLDLNEITEYDIFVKTFDEIEVDLALIGYTLNDDETDLLEIGYNIIVSLQEED